MGKLKLSADDRDELRAWWSIVWPSTLSIALMISMDFTDATMLGHFRQGSLLPSASSALLIISLTSALFQRGPCGAVGTLSANAYGAGQPELAGQRLQIGLVFAALLSICVSPVWFFAGDILRAWSHSSISPADVNIFARWRLVGMMPAIMFSVLRSWMAGRKVTTPALCSAMLGAFTNVLLNYVLIYGCLGWEGFGFVGSPIATALSRWVMFTSLGCLSRREVGKCWPSNPRASFSKARCKEFLKLCIPLTLSGMLEEFNMQLTAVFALHFGPQELATHNCMLTAFIFLSSVMMGCTDGTSTRVSHHIVAGNVQRMKRLCVLAFSVMFSWSFVVMVAFSCLQYRVGMLFSADQEVWRLSGQLSFLVGGAYFIMTFFYLALAVLGGLAKPTVVMVGFVVGCYGVGLPLTYAFGFRVPPRLFAWWPYFDAQTASGPGPSGCGILGLWIGLAGGYAVTTAVAVSRLLCMRSWPGEVSRARAMAELSDTTGPLVEAAAPHERD